MKKMTFVTLTLLTAVGLSRSQTAAPSELSKQSIEISHVKLRLGMTKAEVAEKLSGAQIDLKETNDWILHEGGAVIQFENGKLAFAARPWSNENNDIVDALFGAVSYFNNEGDRACSVVAESFPDPNFIDARMRFTLRRVRITCGEKSIAIDKFAENGHDVNYVFEVLGKRRRHPEDKPQ